jgi:uncharacterized SAM-binding protein YcdF (DUF218 family)
VNQSTTIDWDGIFTLSLTIVIGIASVGLPFAIAVAWVLAIGLNTKTGPATDALVVFGKRLVHDLPDADYRARIHTAVQLATDRPGSRIVILGGQTGSARLTEAAAGERLMRTLSGTYELAITLEQASGDTLTNLRNVRDLLTELSPREPLTLISNRYHLARVGQMAASLGLTHRLCAAEDISCALRSTPSYRWLLEGFYVAWFTTGKQWARLTRNQRMLARVT